MTEYIVDFEAHNANAAIALCDGVHELIVRCRDCRWLREDDALWVCDHWAANIAWVGGMKPDGFCAWGEKK